MTHPPRLWCTGVMDHCGQAPGLSARGRERQQLEQQQRERSERWVTERQRRKAEEAEAVAKAKEKEAEVAAAQAVREASRDNTLQLRAKVQALTARCCASMSHAALAFFFTVEVHWENMGIGLGRCHPTFHRNAFPVMCLDQAQPFTTFSPHVGFNMDGISVLWAAVQSVSLVTCRWVCPSQSVAQGFSLPPPPSGPQAIAGPSPAPPGLLSLLRGVTW